ncbi:hypothetical protein [Streptomyces galbus]
MWILPSEVLHLVEEFGAMVRSRSLRSLADSLPAARAMSAAGT